MQLLKTRGERGKCFEEPTDCESSTRVTPTHRLQLVLNNSTMHLCPPRVFLTKSAIAARDERGMRTCEAEIWDRRLSIHSSGGGGGRRRGV